jgi:hypothetical protein
MAQYPHSELKPDCQATPMPNRTSKTGSELFIVDNSDDDWKVLRYLHDWCQISKGIDIATGYFEIGALLGLKDEWQKVDQIRILIIDPHAIRGHAMKAKYETLDEYLDDLDAIKEKEAENTRGMTLKQVQAYYAGAARRLRALTGQKLRVRRAGSKVPTAKH